jgi:hypothetical protein
MRARDSITRRDPTLSELLADGHSKRIVEIATSSTRHGFAERTVQPIDDGFTNSARLQSD